MDEVMQEITRIEDIVIGGDMNGQVGSDRMIANIENDRVHEKYGFGKNNEVR